MTTAIYATSCPLCTEAIEAGAPIKLVRDIGWVHAACAQGRAIAEQQKRDLHELPILIETLRGEISIAWHHLVRAEPGGTAARASRERVEMLSRALRKAERRLAVIRR